MIQDVSPTNEGTLFGAKTPDIDNKADFKIRQPNFIALRVMNLGRGEQQKANARN
ncbi:MAG: hypothetical protein ACJAT6_000050 [Akkermansiaceae bacterium]